MAAVSSMRRQTPNRHTEMQNTEDKQIPVVAYIITDDEAGLTQGLKLRPVELTRVVRLLSDPHSSQLFERHVHALNRITLKYEYGFLIRDLVHVFKILNICADRVAQHTCYVQPMCKLLHICGLSYLTEKMSDESAYSQIVIESVSQMGYLMRVPNSSVRSALADALISLYCNPPTSQDVYQDLKPASHEYNIRMVESSDVAETLVKSLSLFHNNLEIQLKILRVLQKLSCSSAVNCDKMLQSEAAYRICCEMNSPDPSGYLLFISVEIIWNLLELGGDEVTKQLANLQCVNALKEAFRELMISGCSNYEKQLRNDLLVITTLLCQNPSAPIVESGFAKQIVLFATFSEVKSYNPLLRNLKLTQSHEDFELKKMLINLLEILSKDHAALQILSDGKVLLSLFHYVKSDDGKVKPRDWSPAQFEELQLHAMSALNKLSVLLIDDYMICQGNTRLLLLLEWCLGKEPFTGHGNSFHGSGGRGNKKAQMRQCLRLLLAVVSNSNEIASKDLCDQGILNQLLDVLENFFSTDCDNAIDIELQCDILYILSRLCENDIHRKELFGGQGVDILIQYLKANPAKLSSGLGHHRLMLASVDATWCCAIGCFSTEDLLLEKGGVFYLIDLLQSCPRNMHNLILGCLLELCENPKTIAHIHTWRGMSDITAPHLLIQLWREEEKSMGVLRDETGCIVDITAPIAGAMQREQVVVPQSATALSSSIVDVSENLRAKIYALFAKLGFSDLPGLTTQDYVALAVIEKYLDFKLGEVWLEISSELQVENVVATSPDQEALETINRAASERAKGVAMLQTELLEAEKQQDLHEEKLFYAEVKENHKQQKNTISRWEDFVKRTSDHNHLVDCKNQQQKSIESSKTKPRQGNTTKKLSTTFHDTTSKNLNTTTFQGRHVTVESTPAELTGERAQLLG
nr:cilia- and flagella-associated protein 69 isoform X2 [Ciona intestinalis]XP_018667628.1 cilia- and flagella-associated protein 69 isoform X2 [Ciona intestinalis]|eukprot:XP_002126046.2 cilia- and flagella-associated protein 69 isoform X2 [Ciona intestinalis]